jgi:Domain of unknown function (DUF222)
VIDLQFAPDPDVDEELETEIRAKAADIHARMAALARDLLDFEERGLWRRTGMRNCEDWVTSNLGFDRPQSRSLMMAAHLAQELPQVDRAFAAGELSIDKLRLLHSVATSEDQESWVDTAREASPPELARRCREFRSQRTTGPEREALQHARRRLHTWFDEENMFRISGALPTLEGGRVQQALDTARRRLDAELTESRTDAGVTPSEHPDAARQADALVWMCTAGLGAEGTGSPPPVQLVVHVDYDVLTGANPEGRGHIENGPALSTATLRRLGCSAAVKTLIERDGVPIAVGRSRRIPSEDQRLAVRSRDGFCRHPRCTVPATRCEPHHLDHWIDGGDTEIWDLLSMCDRHHTRHHEGYFHIRRTPDGDLQFLTPDRQVYGTATGGCWKQPKSTAGP